jgi:hypothetical protein
MDDPIELLVELFLPAPLPKPRLHCRFDGPSAKAHAARERPLTRADS